MIFVGSNKCYVFSIFLLSAIIFVVMSMPNSQILCWLIKQ